MRPNPQLWPWEKEAWREGTLAQALGWLRRDTDPWASTASLRRLDQFTFALPPNAAQPSL